MKNVFFLSLFFLISCGENNFKKVEQLNQFRILAIIANNPEVAPGGTSTLSVLLTDKEGGGRVISGVVKSCIDPGISLGADSNCNHDPATVTTYLSIDTVNDADLGAANLYTGLATQTVTVTVPSNILLGRSNREKFNGVDYISIFTFTVGNETYQAVKRVTATSRTSTNSNPTLSSIKLNGQSISIKPIKSDTLSIVSSSPQNFQYQEVNGVVESRQEKAEVAWYISNGEFSKPKMSANETVSYTSDPPAGSVVLLAILRDDRGGSAYKREVLP